MRFSAALLVCWALGAILERSVDAYARQARQRELVERIEAIRVARADRRRLLAEGPVPDEHPGVPSGGDAAVR